jgi:hypothetical protein
MVEDDMRWESLEDWEKRKRGLIRGGRDKGKGREGRRKVGGKGEERQRDKGRRGRVRRNER